VVSNFCGLVLASKYRQRLEGRDKPNCFLDLGPFSGICGWLDKQFVLATGVGEGGKACSIDRVKRW